MPRHSTKTPTRERILDEVERLIAIKGVDGFKLRDVSERLAMKVPAIYKHYRSRDDVLVEVSRRFVALLGTQFGPSRRAPGGALRGALDRLVEFELANPAFVRLALVDFATPQGGAVYVRQAAGGAFEENFSSGPLAAMHARLRALLRAGERCGEFRRVDPMDFYRVITAALLIRLVFPTDRLLLRRPAPRELRRVQRWLRAFALGLLEPRRPGRAARRNRVRAAGRRM